MISLGVLCSVAGSYLLPLKKYGNLASYFFILSVVIGILYAAGKSGTDLPMVPLSMGVILTIGEAIIGGNNQIQIKDGMQCGLIIFTTILVSWLYNLKINYSLKRALGSETALKKERDQLKIKAGEREEYIENLQIERITILHQQAVSSTQVGGFFHDLMNSLTAVNLAIEQVALERPQTIGKAKSQLRKAIASSRRMTKFVNIIRRYNSTAQSPAEYSLRDEIKKIITLYDYRANKSNITIRLFSKGNDTSYGKPADLYQIMNNLLSYAIGNYGNLAGKKPRNLDITITGREAHRSIAIRDYSSATAAESERTAHALLHETGIDGPESDWTLAIAKQLINQRLGGTMSIADNPKGSGITLIVRFQTR